MHCFSLNSEVIRNIFQFAKPLGHHEKRDSFNLGFGFLYYSTVRAVRPKHVLVIGSGFGFSVVCLAIGLKDNGKGILNFVDPSYDVFKHGPLKTVGGRGMWDTPEEVKKHFRFAMPAQNVGLVLLKNKQNTLKSLIFPSLPE